MVSYPFSFLLAITVVQDGVVYVVIASVVVFSLRLVSSLSLPLPCSPFSSEYMVDLVMQFIDIMGMHKNVISAIVHRHVKHEP